MALEDDLNGHNDIAQFLEKFKETPFPQEQQPATPARESAAPVRPAQYVRSFEKLEQKIHELEEKFEASSTQNRLILSELARTREVMERQKDKDAFLEHLSRTIATLRTSVENLSQAQQTQSFAFREAPVQRSFDPLPTVFAPTDVSTEQSYATQQELTQLRAQREEQDRLFNSLRQKASQLKAVNSALDREIKKAQQEKMDALKKSANQAKEILSLRDQLSAAEERFKSFDFEGRIISIKKEYQQKVTHLETQLKEMSDTCMRQVEEIESLKAENLKLQNATAQKESLQAQLADKEQQLADLKQTVASLQGRQSEQQAQQLSTFTLQIRTLEEQRDRLAIELEQSQIALENIRREKELLEKNFKELVIKMNQNDAVISDLREKIDVLGRQNTELAQHNEQLAKSNTVLVQDNQSLSQTNRELTHRNAALTQHNATLTRHTEQLENEKTELTVRVNSLGEQAQHLTLQTQELDAQKAELAGHIAQLRRTNEELSTQTKELDTQKQNLANQVEKLNQEKATLAQDKESLAARQADLTKRAHKLAQDKEALSSQNEQLRSQSAALLAARLVQEHVHKEQLAKAKANLPPADDGAQPVQAPVVRSLGRNVPSPQEEEWEVIPAQKTVRTPITSSADLPEIKVADPIPQEELYEGEDFLEKTGSFIGRMKWSIFRENR